MGSRGAMARLRVVLTLALMPFQSLGAEVSLGTEDVVLPDGYTIEPVLTGLTYPTSMEFGPDGSLYVAEGGYAYGQHWAENRVLKLRPDGRVFAVAGGFRGPITGITFRDNQLFVAHRGMVSVVDLSTVNRAHRVRDVVTGLPAVPNGGHYNSRVAFGPDGRMYFGVGPVTNSAVPGMDSLLMGWLSDFPWMHDAPAREVSLTGENYRSPDALGPNPLTSFVSGGAFLPFGTSSEPGQRIPAHPRPTGAVYRANPDGSGLEVYAWGIRNPFGFDFGPDGRLYMVQHGMDDRGARPAANAPDVLWEIRENGFYGWPDYIAGTPITDERFDPTWPGSRHPGFVMREHPEVQQPLVRFEPHSANMGFDWSGSDQFGFRDEMFVAQFGDAAPMTTGMRSVTPRGYRIVRVNPAAGTSEPFMTIRGPGLESTRGPKRPIDVKFDPLGGTLYLLDFGVMTVRLSADQVGFNPLIRTGTVWRLRRQDATPTGPPAGPRTLDEPDPARLIAWWTVRTPMLGIQKDMRVALIHAQRGRNANILRQHRHREEAQTRIQSVATRAILALKRVDEPNVMDDGTRTLLISLVKWADALAPTPFHLYGDDPKVEAVNHWIKRTEFPEEDYLRQNYAVPGRWQRPLEKDIQP